MKNTPNTQEKAIIDTPKNTNTDRIKLNELVEYFNLILSNDPIHEEETTPQLANEWINALNHAKQNVLREKKRLGIENENIAYYF